MESGASGWCLRRISWRESSKRKMKKEKRKERIKKDEEKEKSEDF
jgi:hypothetical protein